MNDNDNRGPDGVHLVRDDALTTELRAIYAPPQGEAYWTTLEHRIMAALDTEDAWYAVPDRWLRAGLIAAAVTLVVAGGLFLRAQASLNRTMAYENVVEVEGLGSALAQREPLSQEQATLRKLTGHQ
jgi:hypothetical protein